LARKLTLLLLLCLGAAGCGYHVGGQATRVPSSVKVIAVPAFKNQTTVMRLENRLTRAVMQELIERTNYRVVGETTGADAVLEGTLLRATTAPVIFDPTTGRASAVQVEVVLTVELRELKSGKVLYANPNYVFRDQYEITGDLDSFFEEREPAFERLTQDFAATLVSAVLENY
jgi:outer membrane lipopolysaccharide assembly protein LptE/RlpB